MKTLLYLFLGLSLLPETASTRTFSLTPSYEELLFEVDSMKQEIERLTSALADVKKPFVMPSELIICGVRVNLDDPFIYRRVKKEINEIVFHEGMLGNLIDFSGEFFPVIEPILEQNNVPDDLKYLVAVESNFKMKAASYAGAKGPWQFINSSAKRFGLKYDSDYDERYNLTLATEAAVRHLQESYRVFGDWLLAITAYNKGNRGVNDILNIQGIDLSLVEQPNGDKENGSTSENNGEGDTSVDTGEQNLENQMAEQRDSNFWDLVLLVKVTRRGKIIGYRDEQERYVPRVIAMKLIFENIYDYDFLTFDPETKFAPIPVDTVIAHQNMSSLEVAKTLGISLWNLKYLNPQFKGLYPTFLKGKEFYLPTGLAERYEQKKDQIKVYIEKTRSRSHSASKSTRPAFRKGDPVPRTVTLLAGETLWDIAQHYGLSMKAILQLNDITYKSARFLKPGQTIRLQ
ncbi:transglycosylase SLT domain-containing protein [bacterium]|nr:transglycosylase SLT domain-containing protein [bacterium]